MNTMTDEEFKLLMEELAARLPYGVKVQYDGVEIGTVTGLNVHGAVMIRTETGTACDLYCTRNIRHVKPCLLPFNGLEDDIRVGMITPLRGAFEATEERSECELSYGYKTYTVKISDLCECVKRMYTGHVDCNGLLEKGLALDATNLNIY